VEYRLKEVEEVEREEESLGTEVKKPLT